MRLRSIKELLMSTDKPATSVNAKLARLIDEKRKDEGWSDGTPPQTFEALNILYRFTLDAAASKENALCENYFDREANGLLQSWGRHRVFCNPPADDTAAWVAKAIGETEHGQCPIVVMVLPSRGPWSGMVELHAQHILELPASQFRVLDGDGEVQPMMLVTFEHPDCYESNAQMAVKNRAEFDVIRQAKALDKI